MRMRQRAPAHAWTLENILWSLDPDIDFARWRTAIMVVFYETKGSEEGFRVVNEWSSRGKKYKGTDEVKAQWNSLTPERPAWIRLALLERMAVTYMAPSPEGPALPSVHKLPTMSNSRSGTPHPHVEVRKRRTRPVASTTGDVDPR